MPVISVLSGGRGAIAPAPSRDIYFNSVVLLTHMEDDGGSPSAPTDKSNSANDLLLVGGATLAIDQPKFGSRSLKCTNGTGQGIKIADSDDWNWTSVDYTLEFFAWRNASSEFMTLFSQTDGSVGDWFVYWYGDKRWAIGRNGVNELVTTAGNGALDGQYAHYAISKSGSTTRMFRNGVQVQSGTAVYISNSAQPLFIGTTHATSNDGLDGFIDEVRITKGVSRYNGNFTPPSSAFEDS